MARYYRQGGIPKSTRMLGRLKPLLLLVIIIFLLLITWLIYDIFSQNNASESPSDPSKAASSTIAPSTQIQSTPYFQIQTPLKWKAIANETRDNHYVYRQYNDTLVEQELVIDINDLSPEILATTQINRVLAVSVSPEGLLSLQSTDFVHCKKFVKPGTEKTQQIVTMSKVTIPCSPDSTGYVVVVGTVGGTNIMKFQRPNGISTTYKITYRNVSATPNSRDLNNIVKTFETR